MRGASLRWPLSRSSRFDGKVKRYNGDSVVDDDADIGRSLYRAVDFYTRRHTRVDRHNGIITANLSNERETDKQ